MAYVSPHSRQHGIPTPTLPSLCLATPARQESAALSSQDIAQLSSNGGPGSRPVGPGTPCYRVGAAQGLTRGSTAEQIFKFLRPIPQCPGLKNAGHGHFPNPFVGPTRQMTPYDGYQFRPIKHHFPQPYPRQQTINDPTQVSDTSSTTIHQLFVFCLTCSTRELGRRCARTPRGEQLSGMCE